MRRYYTRFISLGLTPNAGPELRLEAGAERTLEAVSSRPWLDAAQRLVHEPRLAPPILRSEGLLVCLAQRC
jgi:hypothetical protein